MHDTNINSKAICQMKLKCLTCICLLPAEGFWHRLQADREDRGEQVQHIRLGRVEEQEKADVRGFERQREADESQKDPEKKYSHTLSPHSNCVATNPTRVPWEHLTALRKVLQFFRQYIGCSLKQKALRKGTTRTDCCHIFVFKLLAPGKNIGHFYA